MKVSFLGNYLCTFKNSETKDDAYISLCKARDKEIEPDFDVFIAGDKELHLIDGQDYKNYRKAISILKSANIKDFNVRQSYLASLFANAISVDLSNIYSVPRRVQTK